MTELAGTHNLEGIASDILVREGRLTREALERGQDCARRWGTTLGDALTASGEISIRDWARSMASAVGLPCADLLAEPPDASLLNPAHRSDYIALGILPWHRNEKGELLLATSRPDAPEVAGWIQRHFPEEVVRLVPTTKFDILWSVQRTFDALNDLEAREALAELVPDHSAKTTFTKGQVITGAAATTVVFLALVLVPAQAFVAVSLVTSILYIASFAFRFLLTWVGADRRVDVVVTRSEVAALRDEDLPVYTILVPMYREKAVLPILVESIRRLDYPRAKLDVKLVLESDDHETIEAAKALRAESIFEIIRVPHSKPKTKPKACNYALRFSRGEFIVIYDAEDVPEPDQLKKVVALFRRSPTKVACVQAKLNYFNRNENFLTRMFTLEYSHWFDYLLPGLHRLGVPIPLGGTSNHFRAAILKTIGAWDPYNVTEDADLGVRLTQEGYRVAVVNSTTFEEACGVLPGWIKQRSRWIKGYMQTWLVHMRHPLQLHRRLGFVGFWGFQLFIGFPPLTALISPLLWLGSLMAAVVLANASEPLLPEAVLHLALFNLFVGNMMNVYFGLLAAMKRRWFALVPWGLLAPAYWALHSVAACKALWQLVMNPHYWEKTQHGVSSSTAEVLETLRAARPLT